MTVFAMPEGVECGITIYLTGKVEGEDAEIAIILSGMTSFADSVAGEVDVQSLVRTQELHKLGTDWRVMNRAEITDYKQRNKEGSTLEIDL